MCLNFQEPEEPTKPSDEFLIINKDKGARLRDERNLRVCSISDFQSAFGWRRD